MRSTKRTFQYKLLAGGILAGVLVLVAWQLFNPTDKKNYELNEKINQRNRDFAQHNPFGFTDKPRNTKKPNGVFRIAVLGDSFIWGDGLPYEKIWSHKLENKLLAQYDSIEVMSWGLCGWSTLDEFNFYKQYGKDYNIDLLIIGWIENDPDVGKIPRVQANAEKDHPLLYKISPALAQKFENSVSDKSYDLWMEQLYSLQNLKDYQVVLNDFSHYLAQNNTRALVVMTPSALAESEDSLLNIIAPMIQQAGFPCLNLYNDLKNKLGHYNMADLHANPVNGHPGDLMTSVFADDVKNYLEEQGYLKQVRRR